MRLWIQVCGGPMGKGYRGVPSLPVQSWLDKREGLGTLERHCLGGGQKLAGRSQGWGCQGRADPPGAPHWRRQPLAPLCCINGPGISGTTFPPVPPAVTLSLLVTRWRRRLCGFVFAAGGPWSLLPRPCRVLVLLNPRGGKGKALQLFRSHVQPLLAQADVSFTLMLTGECLPRRVQGASTAGEPHPPT